MSALRCAAVRREGGAPRDDTVTARSRTQDAVGCGATGARGGASFNLAGQVTAFPRCLAVLFALPLAVTTIDRDPYPRDIGPRGTRLTGWQHDSGGSA